MTSPASTDDGALPESDRKLIGAVCDRFEAAWRAGGRPELKAFLTGAPVPVREPLFHELLSLDLNFRRDDHLSPDPLDYHQRFPEYGAVIDAAFAHINSRSATQFSARKDGPPTTRVGDETTLAGGSSSQIGAWRADGYELLDELGRGGMGVVFRAQQVALNRAVALKVIKAGEFASNGERRRFQNEAEAVAQLDHPNIVPIYEVGESGGLDYFSMKLIAGDSLEKRLASYSADPRAAALLVATAAKAVHHAHQRGILHRDLKPANILVDERGEPHVTDFGLARRVDGDDELTQSGAILGTPAYMSPEQASGDKGALTTATDVYGLGSILYALLTGRAPHIGSSVVETLDKVRIHPPESPSKLNARVPRDLEVVCLKCLEKDPRRRYASARELADDLRRWLDGAPITARPVGAVTRGWMWCRRHPAPASLAALLAVSLLGGFAGITWKWREAERQRNVRTRIEEFWTKRVLAGASTELKPRSERVTVKAMLDLAAARVKGDFGDQPAVEAEIHETAGEAYRSLGEYAKAETHLRAAQALYIQVYGADGRETLRSTNQLTGLLDRLGREAVAENPARINLAACRRALGRDDPTTLEAANELGVVLWHLGKLGEAERLLRQNLAARRRVLIVDHPDTLRSVKNLGLLVQDLGNLDEADTLAQEYEHGIRCARGPNHPDNVVALANLGFLRRNQKRPGEAVPFYRRAWDEARRILGPEHPSTLDAATDYAALLLETGQRTEAANLLADVVNSKVRVWGTDHPETQDARARLARALEASKPSAENADRPSK